jgi:multicomponent Na+:H+ antiporter subunit E
MKRERLQDSLVTRGRTIVPRALILCLGWWTLNEAELAGVWLGAFVVMVALGVSLALSSAGTTWRAGGLLRFAVRFFVGSIRGGVDVARRALARDLALSPTMIRYRVRLAGVSSTQLFTAAISLMPGTLSVALVGRDLRVHMLVDDPRALRLIERLEWSIARAAGEPLEVGHA